MRFTEHVTDKTHCDWRSVSPSVRLGIESLVRLCTWAIRFYSSRSFRFDEKTGLSASSLRGAVM
jgi:hypothetical protein